MKMIRAGMFTVLVSLSVAGSAYAAEQTTDEILVAMASFKTVCGGNTGRACPGDAPVAAPAVPPKAPAPPVFAPAPASPAVVAPAPAPPAFDFSLTNGGTVTLPQASTAVTMITASLLSGAAQQGALSASGFPSGVTSSFSRGTCAPPCFSTLTMTTSSSVPVKSYPITITATSGGLSRSTTFTLTVTAPPVVVSPPAPSPAPAATPAPVTATPPAPVSAPAPSPVPASTPTPTPAAPSSSTSSLAKGDRVQVVKGSNFLNILDAISGNFVGQQPELALGTVTGVPQSTGGRNWVYVDYDTGVDGWSTDRFLAKAGAQSQTPASATPTPASTQTPAPVSTLTAAYVGVTGEDKVGTITVTPNGKPDFHMSVSGLRGTPNKVTITSDTAGTWETPYNGSNWLVAPQYNGPAGDLWFEQYASNRFHVKVRYADGSTDEADATNQVPPTPTVVPPVQTLPTPTPAPTPTTIPNRPPAPSSVTGGNVYYVSSGVGPGAQAAGNDNNPGTEAQPFKTLQKAIPLLNPGYTLIVRGGEYDTVNGLANSGNSIVPSGLSWDQPVTIKAYPGEKPVFRRYLPPDFPYTEAQLQTSFGAHMPTYDECAAEAKRVGVALNFPWGCFSSTGSGLAPGELPPFVNAWQGGYVLNMSNDAAHLVQYIIFDGIDFDARGIIQGLLTFYDGARHLRFQNLEVRNSVHSCVSNPGGDPSVQLDHQWINMKVHHCGMPYDTNLVNGSPAREHPAARFFQSWYMHSGGVLWDGIEVYKVAGAGISPLGNNNIIRNSYFHDNNAMGLICAGNWELYNNVFVTFYSEAAWTYGCKFRNNTFVGKPGSMVGILIKEQAFGDLFENNILIGYNYGITSGQTAGTPAIARNNLIVSGNAAREIYEYENSVVRITRQNNIFGQDPKFMNPAAGDYRLQPGSPAINKGFANGLTSDIGGFARDSQPDIGAYEFGK